jgi:hypothetical protein
MRTPTLHSIAARVLLGAACLATTTSCGGELLRTGRSPVFLVVTKMEAAKGDDAGAFTAFLLSDVETLIDVTTNGVTVKVPTIFNDNARATIRVDAKNQAVTTTSLNAVTLTRYRVNFRRSDGRNTPGVDVPYGFDGSLSATIDAGDSGGVGIAFELIRHQAKLEPPLRNLVGFGGLGFISTIAEITFYGRDQNGNELSATGMLDVQFGDFADKQ